MNDGGQDKNDIRQLQHHAVNVRRSIIQMLAQAGSGHPAGALGLVEIMVALYFRIMRYNRADSTDVDRDLLVLSNGHVCPVLYATLAEAGLIDDDELMSLRQYGSRLQGHPERAALPWLETTSGPLGEGLSQAVGMAYGLKYLLPVNGRQVYCIVGDGELDEGQNYEAIMAAGKYGLNNLTVIVDRNDIQLSGPVRQIMPLDGLSTDWRQAGWNVLELGREGANDMAAVVSVLRRAHDPTIADINIDQPTVIIAHTTPGKGVSFMENDYHWHGRAPTAEQAAAALKELDEAELCID